MTSPFRDLVAASAVLCGCASQQIHNPQGIQLSRGNLTSAPLASAVRAGCSATLKKGDKTFRFDVWLETDSLLGRLDALGPFNTPLASVVWTDSAWKTWLPGQAMLLRGSGPVLNLPVLDLRDIHPSALVAPLLGRSTQVAGPVRLLPGAGSQVAVLPLVPDPTWSLTLDTRTGLPLRRQSFAHGQETEGFTYSGWKSHDGVLVPGTIIRTTPDGQVLELKVREWTKLDSLNRAHLVLRTPPRIDTITIGLQGNGRKVFRIRAGSGDSTVVILPQNGFTSPAEASDEEGSATDSTDVEGDSESEEDEGPPPPLQAPVSKPLGQP